ncbi:hypothetical protein [uncultured Variovorax sp.]|uniref:hypothetical protein n=1 Tax=uncultured Variovorax sp. TaxID=114708 RepID=UPI0025E63D65|nr:hypothetical protein [uncultured Variovorax sp.]
MTPEQHLAHLKRMIQPPYTDGWWAYAKARAEELAMEDAAFAALPSLLHAEWQRIKDEAEDSRAQRKSASSAKPTAQRAIVSRETRPARTPTQPSKASTGRPAFS